MKIVRTIRNPFLLCAAVAVLGAVACLFIAYAAAEAGVAIEREIGRANQWSPR